MTQRFRAGAVAGAALLGFWLGGWNRPAPLAAGRKPVADEAAEPAGRVGYVHLGRVLCESNRGRAHHHVLGALRAEQAGRADALRDEAERAETAARAAVTPEARAPFEAKARELQGALDAAEAEGRQAFEGRADRLVAEMYQEVAMASAALAREHGLDAVQTYPAPPGTLDVRQMKGLIETPGALLYVKRDADLTDEIIRRLDARYSE